MKKWKLLLVFVSMTITASKADDAVLQDVSQSASAGILNDER